MYQVLQSKKNLSKLQAQDEKYKINTGDHEINLKNNLDTLLDEDVKCRKLTNIEHSTEDKHKFINIVENAQYAVETFFRNTTNKTEALLEMKKV
jgi:hypothetical protein